MRKVKWQLLVLGLLLSLAYWWYQKSDFEQASLVSPTPTPAVLGVSIGTRTKTANCKVSGPLPDKECSPGAIFETATKNQICVSGYTKTVRNVSETLKKDVYWEYGIYSHTTGQYEVDHIIPLELGGSNDIANLYPEAAEPRPGFHEKDQLENLLHQKVCDGEITLSKAQTMIAVDWASAYNYYLRDNRP